VHVHRVSKYRYNSMMNRCTKSYCRKSAGTRIIQTRCWSKQVERKGIDMAGKLDCRRLPSLFVSAIRLSCSRCTFTA
jgi:hypothetical protein